MEDKISIQVNRSAGHSPRRAPGGFGDKPKGMLPDNRDKAVNQLFNVREQKNGVWTTFNGVTQEVPSVILYLNYAINNLWALAGMDANESENADKLMKTLRNDEKKFGEIADFLWSFKFDEPGRDFRADAQGEKSLRDWRTNTEKIVRKIFALRQFFVHSNKQDIKALETDETLYRFVEGVLGNAARAATGEDPALKTDKVNKLKVINKFGRDFPRFQLTRKGIIFLVCLGLYKDEAEQFCSLMHDLKLPTDKDLSVKELVGVTSSAKKKALRAFFTHFSYRRGRKSLDAADHDHIMFADIVTHLNKVPQPAYEYLTLEKERNRLADLEAVSTESEENKRDKYALKKRDRVKFSQYAAAFIEDFDVLPCVHFKRFDITPSVGRRKYLFGKENDNAVRTDRHFAVYDGGVRFEWRAPTDRHYGAIKIHSLRSSIAEADLPKIVLAQSDETARGQIGDYLNAYFTAYHRILERMVNTSDIHSFSMDDETYLADFAVISGKTAADIKADFMGTLKPYFPAQLLRYFTKESGVLSLEEKVARCRREIERVRDKANEFIARLEARDEIRALEVDKRPCAAVRLRELNLKYPPNTLKFSDGDFVHQVFTLFNLILTPDKRFRQLPLGEQHRGTRDIEYQMLHTTIGKFALDQSGLLKAVEKDAMRSKTLLPLVENIVARARELGSVGRRPVNGRRPGPRLQDLAVAASEMIVDLCNDNLNDADLADSIDYWYGPLFGVKTGADLSRDNLLRVVLGIDLEKWEHAYDYANNAPHKDRRLDAESHIVSQIPLPFGVVDRFFTAGVGASAFAAFLKGGRFAAGPAIRERLRTPVALRDYYDISPVAEAITALKRDRNADLAAIPGLKTTYTVNAAKFDEAPRWVEVKADVSCPALKAVCAKINRFKIQDQVLLFMACEYQNRAGIGKIAGTGDIYDYFTERVPVDGVLARRNDLLRPVFKVIVEKKDEIARAGEVAKDEKGCFDFYDLQKVYQETRSRDFGVRRELMPRLARFEGMVAIPSSEYERAKERAKAEKRNKSEAIRRMEFGWYQNLGKAMRTLARMTFEEYDTIVEARNLVCHQDNFNLVGSPVIEKARPLLKKYCP